MMKHVIAIQDDTDPTVTVEVDPDADDAEASTLLDSIGNRYIFVHSANGGCWNGKKKLNWPSNSTSARARFASRFCRQSKPVRS
ncbi:MAG: hypothetical protein DYH03_14335 [Nitrospira sp. NTP1]|nr:hypothetical protein [Nitrospira sp. NTP1]